MKSVPHRNVAALPGRAAFGVLFAWFFILLLHPFPSEAAKVVLRITAANPIDKPQKVSIKSDLPARIGTNDIVNADGLNVGYDVRKDRYYVHKEVDLGPRQIKEFRVQLKDVWVIADTDIELYRKRAEDLLGMLKGSTYQEDAEKLKAEVVKNLEAVAAIQKDNVVKLGARPQAHIEAYEKAMRVYTLARQDVGQVENLVLATGKNPGELIGDVRNAPPPMRDIQLKPEQYKIAIIRIVVRNTSPTDARKVPIRRELPAEIRTDDIVDANGLDVRSDPARGACTVFKDDLEVPAGESIVFNVKIRDRWNINGPRIDELTTRATNMIVRIGEREKFPEIAATLDSLIAGLAQIKAEKTPQTLNEQYVAFFRQQSARVDEIETKINRVEAALKPMTRTSKLGFNVKAPSMKTTWILIYIILGFLAVMSLLFFLRWYGTTSAEKMDDKQGPAGGK